MNVKTSSFGEYPPSSMPITYFDINCLNNFWDKLFEMFAFTKTGAFLVLSMIIFQGFNTGIVLYHLENMRKSHLYNKYVHPETGGKEIIALANHYEYASHLGDQVSFNIILSFPAENWNFYFEFGGF